MRPTILSFVLLSIVLNGFAQPLTPVWPKDGWVTDSTQVSFSWNAYPGANQYQLELATNPAFTGAQQFTTPAIALAVATTLGQHYYWRVWADTGNGFQLTGPASAFRTFSPATLPRLVLWLRADSNVTTTGTSVDSWSSITPPGINFAQGTANKRPTLNPNGPNGQPVVQFDGSNDMLSAGDVLDLDTNSRTLFIVGLSNKASNASFIAKAVASGASNRWGLTHSGSAKLVYLHHDLTAQTMGLDPITGKYLLNTITTNRQDEVIYFHQNNTLKDSLTNIDGTYYNFQSTFRLLLGAYGNATDNGEVNFLDGAIPEVVVCDTSLPDTLRLLTEQYLRHRYARALNLGLDNKKTYGVCDVVLDAGPDFETYQWSTGDTGSSYTVTTSGTYSVTVTDPFGYTSVDSIEVVVPDPPEVLSQPVLCSGDTLVWNPGFGSEPYTYQWSDQSAQSTLAIATPGNYSVTITDTFGCVYQSPVVTVQEDSTPVATTLGPDTSLCTGNLLGVQTGNYPVTYQWNTGSTTDTTTVTTGGIYTVTATSVNGCTGTDSINVTISGVAPSVAFTADTVCLGDTTTLTDQSTIPAPYSLDQWIWTSGNDTLGTGPQIAYPFSQSGAHPITLTVVSDGSCVQSRSDSVRIWPSASPAFTFTPDTACPGAPVFFADQSAPGLADTITTWRYDFGGGQVRSGPDTLFVFPGTGDYPVTLTITTGKGCAYSSADTVPVRTVSTPVSPTSLIQPAPGHTSLAGQPVHFNWNDAPGNSYYRLEIATDPGFTQIVLQAPFLPQSDYSWSSGQAGTYYWRVWAYNACSDSLGTAARSFTLIDLAQFGNLRFWLQAGSGITKDGTSRISAWQDGVQGLVGAQLNTNRQPLLVDTSDWNRQPVVRFDGNDFLSFGDTLDIGQSNRTAFVVGQSNLQSSASFYAKAVASGATNRYALIFDGSGNLTSLYHDVDPKNASVGDSAQRPRIYTTVADRVGSTGINYLYTSGTFRSLTPGLLSTSYKFNSNFRFLLGAYGNANDSGELLHLDGDIGEVIFYYDALADPDRLQVEAYLRHKYSPPVSLGPDIYVEYGFCDTTLRAAQPWFAQYAWNTGDTTPSIAVNKPGLYHVTVTDVFGYVSSDTVRLWHPGRFLPDTAICLGDTLTWDTRLSPSEYTFFWPDGSSNSSFEITQEGHYWVIIQDQDGCFITDTIYVDVDSFAIQATLGPDANLCSGNEIGLAVGANEAVSYQWSTGDNTPTTTVQNTGDYWVEVTNVNGCLARDTFHVQIIGTVPTPDFSAATLCMDRAAQFTDQSQAAPGDALSQWMWAFGDDSASMLQHPEHTYADSGTYDVTLTVSTTDGCMHSLTKTIFVHPLPDLNFSESQQKCHLNPIQFADNSLVYNGFMDQWHWDFGDGDTSIQQNPVHTYQDPGFYTVQMIGTSNHGCRDTVSNSFTVVGSPLANFEFGPACSGQLTHFTDRSSDSLSTVIIQWSWDFDDGTNSNNRNPSHIFNNPGTYQVELEVKANSGCSTDTVIPLTVSQSPVASFAPDSGCVGTPIQFTDETDTFNVGIQSWQWQFGDGGSDTLPNPVHTYTDAGTYGVQLVVEDAAGCFDSITQPVMVSNNPQAAFTFNPTFGAAPIDVTFQATNPGVNDFAWYVEDSLGNETFAGTGSNLVFNFTKNGVYQVTQIVTNPSGCGDTVTRELFVAVPILDLWVEDIILVQDIQPDGTYKVNMAARVRNKGSRVVNSFDLFATLGAGSTIVEGWEGAMSPGDVVFHQFQSAFFVADVSNNPFICIEAKNINGSEADDFPADNILCEPIQDLIKVLNPYPNPAGSSVTVDVVIPKAEPLTVRIFNSVGQEVRLVHDSPGTRGLNRFKVSLDDLPNGTFFVQVQYREDVYVKAFVVGR